MAKYIFTKNFKAGMVSMSGSCSFEKRFLKGQIVEGHYDLSIGIVTEGDCKYNITDAVVPYTSVSAQFEPNPSVPPKGTPPTPPTPKTPIHPIGTISPKKKLDFITASDVMIFVPSKSKFRELRQSGASIPIGTTISGIPVKMSAVTRDGSIKTGEFIYISRGNATEYVLSSSVIRPHSNAEGDKPVATPATVTPTTPKTGIMSTIENITSDKSLLIGAGAGAAIGLTLAFLTGSNKIGIALVGAGIGGWIGHSNEKMFGAEGIIVAKKKTPFAKPLPSSAIIVGKTSAVKTQKKEVCHDAKCCEENPSAMTSGGQPCSSVNVSK